MAYLILVLAFLAMYHFIYDSILAPNWRHNLRYNLFDLRDQLVMLRINDKNAVSQTRFDSLYLSINRQIYFLPQITLGKVFNGVLEFAKGTPEQNKQTLAKLNSSQEENKEIQKIIFLNNWYYVKAFLINTGGWALYASPFIIFLLLLSFLIYLLSNLKGHLMKLIRFIGYTTDKEMSQMSKNSGGMGISY